MCIFGDKFSFEYVGGHSISYYVNISSTVQAKLNFMFPLFSMLSIHQFPTPNENMRNQQIKKEKKKIIDWNISQHHHSE